MRTRRRQGDALLPTLFSIALKSVMRGTLAGATEIKIRYDQQLVVAGYANNDIIMAENEEDLKRTISNLTEEGKKLD